MLRGKARQDGDVLSGADTLVFRYYVCMYTSCSFDRENGKNFQECFPLKSLLFDIIFSYTCTCSSVHSFFLVL